MVGVVGRFQQRKWRGKRPEAGTHLEGQDAWERSMLREGGRGEGVLGGGRWSGSSGHRAHGRCLSTRARA